MKCVFCLILGDSPDYQRTDALTVYHGDALCHMHMTGEVRKEIAKTTPVIIHKTPREELEDLGDS